MASLLSSIPPSTDCSAARSWGGVRPNSPPPSSGGGASTSAPSYPPCAMNCPLRLRIPRPRQAPRGTDDLSTVGQSDAPSGAQVAPHAYAPGVLSTGFSTFASGGLWRTVDGCQIRWGDAGPSVDNSWNAQGRSHKTAGHE